MPDSPRFAGRISDWILYKDKQLLVFNKPAGLPVQPDKTGDQSLLGVAGAYARHDVYPAHRLDRPVSGVVVLGKKPSAQAALTRQFKAGKVGKQYLAIVGERPAEDEATLTHYLRNGKGNKSLVSEELVENSRESVLSYRYLASSDNYHLLLVELKTGRKHQIRAQLAHVGSPIYGDVKYGSRRAAPDRALGLHGYRIQYVHPTSEQRMEHVAPVPDSPLWASFADTIKSI